MRNLRYCFRWLITLGIVIHAVPTAAQIGMVTDQGSNKVIVFDGATNTVLGTISIPTSPTLYDCAVLANQGLGFTVDFQGKVWVIDLTTSPPSLAAGTNPIPISNNGEDIAITADQQFLVICDGSGGSQPVSAVRIATRTQVSTLAAGAYTNTVETCPDGSVLAGIYSPSNLYRLKIDNGGNLTNTGEVLSGGSPMNLYCAPNGISGISVDWETSTVRSFKIQGLALVDTRSLPANGLCGAISPAGDRIYVRTLGSANRVVAFGFNSVTGALDAAPLYSIPVAAAANSYFGIEQMALSPDGMKLYVPEPATNSVRIYDASSGSYLTSITDPSIVTPVGISFGGVCPNGSISGQLFDDFNGDGVFDPSEPGLGGWTIDLAGPVTGTTVTDVSGNYRFPNLPAGTYAVSEEPRFGWAQTLPAGAGAYIVFVGCGQEITGRDFGNYQTVGRGNIFGTVFDDRNGNGAKDPDEPGLYAWRVQLSGPGGLSTLTDANGNYAFSNIIAGSYAVTIFLPSGWAQTLPPGGQPRNVTVVTGGTVAGVDFGTRIVTGVEGIPGNPTEYELYQNFPNPFNPTTRLSFYLPKDGYVTLKVYNVLGIEVTSLFEGRMSVGIHSLVWDAQDIPSGLYVYRLTAGNFTAVKKMVLMK